MHLILNPLHHITCQKDERRIRRLEQKKQIWIEELQKGEKNYDGFSSVKRQQNKRLFEIYK